METILLASSSPRRKEILQSLSIPFAVLHPDIDESVLDHLAPDKRVVALAAEKARAGKSLLETTKEWADCRVYGSGHDPAAEALSSPPRLILAADTLVTLPSGTDWKTIGKPEDRARARAMLQFLSGKTHIVFTGLCVVDTIANRLFTALSESSVSFAAMNEKEIECYLDCDEWQGAAGAYRVQGRGSLFIETIHGSWSGVMGLPIRELYGILKDAEYDFDCLAQEVTVVS